MFRRVISSAIQKSLPAYRLSQIVVPHRTFSEGVGQKVNKPSSRVVVSPSNRQILPDSGPAAEAPKATPNDMKKRFKTLAVLLLAFLAFDYYTRKAETGSACAAAQHARPLHRDDLIWTEMVNTMVEDGVLPGHDPVVKQELSKLTAFKAQLSDSEDTLVNALTPVDGDYAAFFRTCLAPHLKWIVAVNDAYERNLPRAELNEKRHSVTKATIDAFMTSQIEQGSLTVPTRFANVPMDKLAQAYEAEQTVKSRHCDVVFYERLLNKTREEAKKYPQTDDKVVLAFDRLDMFLMKSVASARKAEKEAMTALKSIVQGSVSK